MAILPIGTGKKKFTIVQIAVLRLLFSQDPAKPAAINSCVFC